MHYGPDHLKEIYGVVFFFILNFMIITTLGFFSSIGLRYWNRPTIFGKKMASNSYDMYLSHYIFVLAFQLVLYIVVPGIPGLFKFVLVSMLSIIFAYIVSEFFIKSFPRATIITTIVMFATMVLLINP
jgi:hypothetical protein